MFHYPFSFDGPKQKVLNPLVFHPTRAHILFSYPDDYKCSHVSISPDPECLELYIL